MASFARDLALALALGSACACHARSSGDSPALPADASPKLVLDVGTLNDLSPTLPDAGKQAFQPPDAAAIASGAPAWAKSVGHTSVVLHVRLASGAELAFRPESRRGKTRYRGEIAAYRLATALGLPNVLPAVPRTFDARQLEAALEPGSRELFRSEAIARAGTVRGAGVVWLRKLEFFPIESAPWPARWKGWLGSSEVAGADRALAAQIGTLVVFDVLTGNWDRWSGGNVALDRPTGTVLYVDNDGAFFDPPPAGPLAAQLKQLEKTERFSRSLVAALRKMTPISLADAFGDDAPGTPLLAARVVAGVDERRRTVLARVDRLIEERGDAATLAFP